MTKERGGSLIFLSVGIYGLIFSIQLPLGKWNEPGSAVFPLSLSILLGISGILWFIRGGRADGAQNDWRVIVRGLINPLKIVGLTGAFILVLDRLGYLVTSSLYMFFLFLWVSRYRLWIALSLAIFLGVGSWYFFGKFLVIQLPRGFWFQ